jgi:5-methylcytosine-specific restriction enzyme B
MARFKLQKKYYHLEKEDILNALRGVHPQPAYDFSINIHGKDYPIKQAISAATGLTSEKFSGSESHEILRKLGFVIENFEQRQRRLYKRKHRDF